jgi:hypothetical protein
MFEVNSPYSQTEIKALGTHEKRGVHTGFKFPDGKILINFSDQTSHSVLAQIARQLGAELISISGTWTFTPDNEQEFKVIRIPRS